MSLLVVAAIVDAAVIDHRPRAVRPDVPMCRHFNPSMSLLARAKSSGVKGISSVVSLQRRHTGGASVTLSHTWHRVVFTMSTAPQRR